VIEKSQIVYNQSVHLEVSRSMVKVTWLINASTEMCKRHLVNKA